MNARSSFTSYRVALVCLLPLSELPAVSGVVNNGEVFALKELQVHANPHRRLKGCTKLWQIMLPGRAQWSAFGF